MCSTAECRGLSKDQWIQTTEITKFEQQRKWKTKMNRAAGTVGLKQNKKKSNICESEK